MSLLTRFLNLFRKEALERELDEELRFHLEKRIESNLQRGMTREEAEADAHRQFGSFTAAKDGMKEVRMKAKLTAVLGIAVLTGTVACSQYTAATEPSTFRGCLQGDTTKGFSLLAPTGDGSGADRKGQTLTYKVLAAGQDLNLSQMANKVVEITGTLSTAEKDTGQMPAPVTDSVRSPGGAGGTGKWGENTAFIWANGTVTAKSIRELEPTCAVRFAPDQDK